MTPTLPKSQGLEITGSLSKKSKRPKSKRPPTETKRNIQLVSTGLPSTLDEGTHKSKPLPESTDTHPQDSRGNKQSLDNDITSTTSDEGTGAKYQVDQTQSTRLRYQSLLKNEGKPSHRGELDTQPMVLFTYADVRDFLLSDDKSEEAILGASEEMDEEPQVAGIAERHHQKYDNTLPLTERQLVKYLRKMSQVLFTRISEDN
nr:hypothetical protein [Tanacetum cinerariifolium]GEZ03390.1 hypothetical protein [Tanacetum cinerariifolium]